MRSMFVKLTVTAAALTAAGVAHAALMTLLPPCDSKPLFGTTFAEDPSLGSVAVDDRWSYFECSDSSGTLKGWVYSFVDRNHGGTGDLDFYYRVFNDPGSTRAIKDVTVLHHPTTYADDLWVEYRPDSLGTAAPNVANRSCDGTKISFVFSNGVLGPGDDSHSFFVRPSRKEYGDEGKILVHDGILTCTTGGAIEPQ
jgi:hypothetical protein